TARNLRCFRSKRQKSSPRSWCGEVGSRSVLGSRCGPLGRRPGQGGQDGSKQLATGEGVSGMHRIGDDSDVTRRSAHRRALRRTIGTLLLTGAIGFGFLSVIGVAGPAGGPTDVITTLAASSSSNPSSSTQP